MRIRELDLIRYGKFTDRSLALPRGERDFHLVVGPNEAGKSTVRAAISDWLFGIPMRTPLAFLHPMPELRIGGCLEEGRAGVPPLAFHRIKARSQTLRAPDDTPLPDTVLQPWLGSLQAQAFNRMYALDHGTLVEGGAGILSASDDVGRLLFQSAAGLEHLGEVRTRLEDEGERLWAPRRAGSRAWYQALDAHDAAAARLKQATLRTKDWKTHHDALTATEAEFAQARQQEADIRQQRQRLERVRRVRPLLLERDEARQRLDAVLADGEIPLLPEDATQTIETARREMALVQANLMRLQQERAQTQAELDALRPDTAVLALAEDITELNERRLQFRAHATDLVKRHDELLREWTVAQEIARDLGWPADSEDALRARLPAAPARARLARLLREHEGLTQRLQAAQKALAERERQLQRTRDALAQLGTDAVDPALPGALQDAQQLGDHAGALRELTQRIARLDQQIDSGLAAMGSWRRPPEALTAMAVPDTALVQGLIDEQRTDAAELRRQQETVDDAAQALRRLETDLQRLLREFQPVSRAQLQTARQARDQAWQHLKAAPDTLAAQAPAYEGQVLEADALADARLERAQYDAERQSTEHQLAQQRLELEHLSARLQATRARIDARDLRWTALTDACGLPGLPLALAPGWLAQRQDVLARVADRAELLLQRAAREQQARMRAQTLWTLLGETDPASAPGPETTPDLAVCVRQASARIEQASKTQGQREALTRQLRDAQDEQRRLQDELAQAQAQMQTWGAAWQAAATAAGYAAGAPADQVEAELAAIDKLDRRLEQVRGIRTDRIETMQSDLDGLAVTARALAERVAPELAQHGAEQIALALTTRLEAAREAAQARARLLDRLERLQTEQTATLTRQDAVRAGLAPLVASAGVDELDALSAAARRSDLHRQTAQALRAVEARLAQAADGQPLDALRAECADRDPDALVAELEALNQRAAEVVERIAVLAKRHGTERAAFEAHDGSAAAAQAEAERQEALATLGDTAERFVRLHAAARLLRWSMERFRETRQGPMLAKASAIFSALTLGSFSRLLVDAQESTPRLFGVRPDGQQVDVEGMSEGSRDQLYLALRLAALELQVEQGSTLPLIADDLFINFDDRRTAAGLQVLGELSRRMQIVFLTHHDHLVPLAQQVLGADVNVVWL